MKKTSAIFLIIVLMVGIFSFLFYNVKEFDSFSIWIFSDISECQNFINEGADAEIEIYETPEKDQDLLDLAYENFFAGKYSSSELSFEIFAYEFKNDDMAKQYFKNITGKEEAQTSTYSAVKGMFEYRLVVISNENAYSVYTENKNIEKVMQILENTFTSQIY